MKVHTEVLSMMSQLPLMKVGSRVQAGSATWRMCRQYSGTAKERRKKSEARRARYHCVQFIALPSFVENDKMTCVTVKT
jgi:hypothetical protein